MLFRFCDCCGKDRLVKISLKEVLDSKKIIQKKYNIVTCEKCGHSFIDPMPLEMEEIINFYPKDYYAHSKFSYPNSIKAKLKLSLTRLYYKQHKKNKLLKLLQKIFYLFFKHTVNEPPIISNGKLLDIGCGNGEYLNMAKQFGWDAYGIELNEKAVNVARSIGLQVKKESAEKTGYKTCFFDIVRMWNVLEHLISPKKALSEVVRILKKGGYILTYTPNFNSIDKKYFGEYWASLEVPRHLHFFSIKSLKFYFNQVGLVLERVMYPGTIFSMLVPTIRAMRDSQINIFSIVAKVIAVIIRKIFNRLLGNYSEDVGICVLARKIKED